MIEPLLFPADQIPKVPVAAAEHSQEARDAALLHAVERIRFNDAKLAAYEADLQATDLGFVKDYGRDFLDFVLSQLGGRSQ